MKQSSQGNFSPNIKGDGNSYTAINGKIQKVSNEVRTIQTIVHKLTIVANTSKMGNDDTRGKIDPYEKIKERFKDYDPALSSMYLDLAIKYGTHYEYTLDELQPGRIDIDNISRFLRQVSIGLLEKNNFNPIIALDEMCSYFEEKFFDDEDFEFDHNALRFFLYQQLVKCNIFPNIYETD